MYGRRKPLFVLVMAASVFTLCACSGGDASEPDATPAVTATEQATGVETDDVEVRIGAMKQEYEGGNKVEILMLQQEDRQEELEAFNDVVQEGPMQIYKEFQESKDFESIDILSYPFEDDDRIQIVTSCTVYPETRPDINSKLWSYCFDKKERRVVGLDEILKEKSLTSKEIASLFKELYEPADDGETIVGVEVTGFLINNLPSGPVTNFLLEVMLERESDPYKGFFLYMSESDKVMGLDGTRLFDPDVWDMVKMDPPLTYESGDLESSESSGVELSLDTSGFEETSKGEYGLDGVLNVQAQNFPALADEMYDKKGVKARIKELEGELVRFTSVGLSEEYTERMTYPVWLVEYEKGLNEDTVLCKDIYFQTDTGEYRVHTQVPIDLASDYQDRITALLASVTLEDAN